MPHHYGDHTHGNKPKKKGLKLNMKTMPAPIREKLTQAMKKKKKKPYNPYGKGSGMNPTKASYTTGP